MKNKLKSFFLPFILFAMRTSLASTDLFIHCLGYYYNLSSSEVQLCRAISKGDKRTVDFLLAAGVDPNIRDQNSWTLLMHVLKLKAFWEKIRRGLGFEMASSLINAKDFNPNLCNNMGDTALHLAIRFGGREATEKLLEMEGININAHGKFGDTPLHLLVQRCVLSRDFKEMSNIFSIIDKVMAHSDFDLEVKNNDGKTVRDFLMEVIEKNNKLMKQIEKVSQGKRELSLEEKLRNAIIDEDFNMVKDLIKNPSLDINWQDSRKRTLLMYAVGNGNFEIIQMMLQLPEIDFSLEDNEHKTALSYANDNRDERVIDSLKSKSH